MLPHWVGICGSHRPLTMRWECGGTEVWTYESSLLSCYRIVLCRSSAYCFLNNPPNSSPNNSAISRVRGCFRQACKVLLDAGAPLDVKASSGGTALMFAAAAGYTDVVNLLLEKGADANASVKVQYDVVPCRAVPRHTQEY